MFKGWRSILIVVTTGAIFWFVKFVLNFPSTETEIIGIVLTIASILFGFLSGFFISELWSRYTELRELQGTRAADGLNMITYAQHFYQDNPDFENNFKLKIEKCAIVDEICEWEEGHLEVPYYRDVATPIESLNVSSEKSANYFYWLLNSYNRFIESTIRMDMLGKERLFPSEWIVLGVLSSIIALSILFLDVTHIFAQVVLAAFPAVIALALLIIYDLDTMTWSKNTISLEPNARLFGAIGAKRFYLKKKEVYLKNVSDYRTEDDLTGELKEVYNNVMQGKQRK